MWLARSHQTGINSEVALLGSDLKYYTLTHNQAWFFPSNKSLTLMLNDGTGYGSDYGETRGVPFFKNFYGGGLGPVHGFENGTLSPRVYDKYGEGINYNDDKKVDVSAELLFPMLGIRDARIVRLSLFADADNV